MDDHLETVNPLNFPSYTEKIKADGKKTGLNEAVLDWNWKSEMVNRYP